MHPRRHRNTRLLEPILLAVLIITCLAILVALGVGLGVGLTHSDDDDGGGGGFSGGFTHSLGLSTAGVPLWTASPNHKVTRGETPPSGQKQQDIKVFCARQEFEPFQLVLGPATSGAESVVVRIDPFPTLDEEAQQLTMRFGLFDSAGVTDGLTTPRNIEAGETVTVTEIDPFVVWFTVHCPQDAANGHHYTTIHANDVEITVDLYVFDFEIPLAATFRSQMAWQTAASDDSTKQMLFGYRHSPKFLLSPLSFSPQFTWDTADNPQQCMAIHDGQIGVDGDSIDELASRYVLGENWNSVGFSTHMLFEYVTPGEARPATFCAEGIGTEPPINQGGTAGYNAEWTSFISALSLHLEEKGMLEKSYYYVMAELDDDGERELAAHICTLTKNAAPDLRIAVREEPIESIYNECGYDIWISKVSEYSRDVAWERIGDHEEEIWWYSSKDDEFPLFNPTVSSNGGMHTRIIAWAAWAERVRGFSSDATDDIGLGGWFDGLTPTIRAELMRETFEDYEYLYLANDKRLPRPFVEEKVDRTVRSVVTSPTSWENGADAANGVQELKRDLGLYIEDSRSKLPVYSR